MPETSLTLDYEELQKRVAFLACGTRQLSTLSVANMDLVNACIQGGLRRFYYPKQIMPGLLHDWSFLRVAFTLTTEVGTQDYVQPFNFGGVEGPLHHDANDGVKVSVTKTSPDQILRQRQLAVSVTNWPVLYAERPVPSGGRTGQRYEIMLWPSPSAAYIFYGTQRIQPLAPNGSQMYLYGGPEHSQTIIEACLAQVELDVDGSPGPHAAEFVACLQTSIMLDQTMHQADTLGYNGDGADMNSSLVRPDGRGFEQYGPATYNNIAYTGP